MRIDYIGQNNGCGYRMAEITITKEKELPLYNYIMGKLNEFWEVNAFGCGAIGDIGWCECMDITVDDREEFEEVKDYIKELKISYKNVLTNK